MNKATVFSPATLANLGSGFDLLGLAINEPGDTVHAKKINEKKIIFLSDPNFPNLPKDHNNVVYHVAQTIYDIVRPDFGIEISLQKGIPESSGMGGSAASSTAAAFAVNCLLDTPFSKEELLPFAIEGERLASGSPHADNVAPALFGGLCLLSPGNKTEVIHLPVSKKIFWILVHPEIKCNTRKMREILPKEISLATHIRQSGLLATLVSGFFLENEEWISRGMIDLIAEPNRAAHILGFDEVRLAALNARAAGFGISGSGPSVFAISNDRATAELIADAMQQAFLTTASLKSQKYISTINTKGTFLLE